MKKLLLAFTVLIFPPVLCAQSAEDLFARAKRETNTIRQIDLLGRVLEKSPAHVGAYHYRADAYMKLGKKRQALADYNQVVALRPKDPFRYYARGLAYMTLAEPALALADFTKAISLKPSYTNFYLARARALRALGKYTQALADYHTYSNDLTGLSDELLHEELDVALAAYQDEYAKLLLDELARRADDSARWHIAQGRIWLNDHKTDEAVSAFSKAVNRAPRQPEPYRRRAQAFKEMGDFQAALEDYSRALELEPKAYWFNKRGLVYEEAKDFNRALEDYSRAISLDPSWAVPYNNSGFAYLNLKEYAKAKEDFQTAIKLDPSAPTPYINLAGVYWLHKKDRKRVYENLEKALRRHFSNYDVLYDEEQKGWMFKGINQTAEFRAVLYK